jgi:2-haloacid dehalogenase/putative hydrolase of the HAD superfamily
MAAPRPYEVVTFDCYGTLIDWEGGLATAIMRAAWADGVRLERGAIIRAYMAAEREVEAGGYRSYREVLADSARGVAARLGWRLDPARASFLAESVPSWVAFPDTNAALERLHAAGYALGILSNIDDDLLTATRRHFTTASADRPAQQVRAYKPARPHFDAARRAIGGRVWLHVGQGYFHDMVPARTQGIPNAWINRNGDTPDDGGRTDREFPTLRDLADWLAPAR